jgi:hypothetical protein
MLVLLRSVRSLMSSHKYDRFESLTFEDYMLAAGGELLIGDTLSNSKRMRLFSFTARICYHRKSMGTDEAPHVTPKPWNPDRLAMACSHRRPPDAGHPDAAQISDRRAPVCPWPIAEKVF